MMTEVAALGLRVSGVADIDSASSSLDRFTKSSKSADQASGNLTAESRNTSKSLADVAREGDKSSASMSRLSGAAKAAAGALAAALSVRQIQVYSDTWSDLTSRIQVSIGPQQNAAVVMQRLGDIARMTYSNLEATADSFARNSVTLRALGKSTNEMLDYTEALNNALVVSGAKAHAFEMVQNGLSRAMAEGAMKAQELDLVLNYGTRVAELLADELGVNITQLRQLASDGKITGDVIYSSLVKNMELLAEQAESMPATIGDAFTLMRNAVLQSVGVYDQQNGLSEDLAENLVAVSDAIRDTDWTPYISGIVTAAKVAGTFAIAMYAIPALQGAWTLALAAKTASLKLFTAQVVTATGTLGLLQRSLMVVAAAFAGWQIGTYLRNEFEIVEKAGIALMGGLHTMTIRVRGFFERMGESISFALTNPLDAFRNKLADLLQSLTGLGQGALRALGLDGFADAIGSGIEGIRSKTGEEHKAMLEQMKKDTQREADAVSDIYADMFADVGKNSGKAAEAVATLNNETETLNNTVTELTAAQKALATAFEQTLAGYHRQLTLAQDATEVEQLLYEVQHGRLQGLLPAQAKMLDGMAKELDMRNKLARAAEAGKGFDSVMNEISGMSGNAEIDRLNEQYAQRKEVIDRALETEYLTKQQHDAAMIELDTVTANARKQVLDDYNAAQQASALQTMASIVSITSTQVNQLQGLLDESSGISKAFFAITQTLAAANAVVHGIQSAMAIRSAYATMAASAGYGASALLAAGEIHAGVAQAMGFASAGLIMGQTIAGFQSGGYTGNVGTSQVAGVVHGKEYVFDAASTARIGVDNLEAMRSGRAMPGNVVPFPTARNTPASSGGGGDTVVNLYEDASKAGRTQTQQIDGKTVIDVFVANIRSDGNAAKAMQQAFGLRRAGR